MGPVVGIPIKPFGIAKARLSRVLDAPARARLGMAIARHTIDAVTAAGGDVVVVTGDEGVASWVRTLGHGVVDETGGGLDAAAGAVVDHATAAGRPWLIVHADLPLLTPADLDPLLDGELSAGIIAPSHDGGTSAIGGEGRFGFRYGSGSFTRHLAAMPSASVVTSSGLGFDLDTPDDLRHVAGLPAGRWLAGLLPAAIRS
jgi:2-phospho-L-lactate/phosphoenolpyruvate guanylyltransferase